MSFWPGNSTATMPVDCISKSRLNLVCIFALALPVHIFLLWVLFKRFADGLPRHAILKSLCLSDVQLLLLGSLSIVIARISNVAPSSLACKILQRSFTFHSTITLIASCGTIIGLSVERYIACIYCLRLHLIVTEKRVTAYLILLWAMAACFGLATALLAGDYSPVVNPREPSMLFTYAMIVMIFSTCFVLISIQVTLFFLYRKKLRITPHQAFGERKEAAHAFKRQVKTTISVAALAIFFTICLFPLTLSYLNKAIHGSLFEPKVHTVLGILGTSNTIFDPLVYGLGLADVRKKTFHEIRRAKRWLKTRFGAS